MQEGDEAVPNYLFNTEKLKYVKGKKPDVECILCALRDGHPDVENLEVFRTENFIISVNLYPFNPGHLMIFPREHLLSPEQFSPEQALEMHTLFSRTLTILKKEFNPSGFNAGYNIGTGSGASIEHIHQHIVPRYENEVGFLDVLGGTRIVVTDPVEVMERLRKRFVE
ncbi:MAG: HIT domain-containing protein [bacterium]|nr:HIT domain-containing protein [bacterium]